MTNYFGQVVEMDGQGRLLLPQNLRDKAGLAGDLAVMGLQTRLSAVNDEQQVARLKAAPLTGDDFAALAITGCVEQVGTRTGPKNDFLAPERSA